MTAAEPTGSVALYTAGFQVEPVYANSAQVYGYSVWGSDGGVTPALADAGNSAYLEIDRRFPLVNGNAAPGQPEVYYSLASPDGSPAQIDPATASFSMGLGLSSTGGGRVFAMLVDLTATEDTYIVEISQFEPVDLDGNTDYTPVYWTWRTGEPDGDDTILTDEEMASVVAIFNAGNLGIRFRCELGLGMDTVDIDFFKLYWGGTTQEIFTPAYIDAAIDADLLDTGVIFRNG